MSCNWQAPGSDCQYSTQQQQANGCFRSMPWLLNSCSPLPSAGGQLLKATDITGAARRLSCFKAATMTSDLTRKPTRPHQWCLFCTGENADTLKPGRKVQATIQRVSDAAAWVTLSDINEISAIILNTDISSSGEVRPGDRLRRGDVIPARSELRAWELYSHTACASPNAAAKQHVRHGLSAVMIMRTLSVL